MGMLMKVVYLIPMYLCLVFFGIVETDKILYGEDCSWHGDCQTNICHPISKTCDCFQLRSYDKQGRKVDQIVRNGICLSRISQMCTLPTIDDDGLPPIRCIPNATCTVYNNIRKGSSVHVFGKCACLPMFKAANDMKECIPKDDDDGGGAADAEDVEEHVGGGDVTEPVVVQHVVEEHVVGGDVVEHVVVDHVEANKTTKSMSTTTMTPFSSSAKNPILSTRKVSNKTEIDLKNSNCKCSCIKLVYIVTLFLYVLSIV